MTDCRTKASSVMLAGARLLVNAAPRRRSCAFCDSDCVRVPCHSNFIRVVLVADRMTAFYPRPRDRPRLRMWEIA